MKLIHRSPLGPLHIPGVGVVKPGEPFDGPAVLLRQSDLYFKAEQKRRKPTVEGKVK